MEIAKSKKMEKYPMHLRCNSPSGIPIHPSRVQEQRRGIRREAVFEETVGVEERRGKIEKRGPAFFHELDSFSLNCKAAFDEFNAGNREDDGVSFVRWRFVVDGRPRGGISLEPFDGRQGKFNRECQLSRRIGYSFPEREKRKKKKGKRKTKEETTSAFSYAAPVGGVWKQAGRERKRSKWETQRFECWNIGYNDGIMSVGIANVASKLFSSTVLVLIELETPKRKPTGDVNIAKMDGVSGMEIENALLTDANV